MSENAVHYSPVKQSCVPSSITLVLAWWILQCYTYLFTYGDRGGVMVKGLRY
jgi:hypothetical protein